MRRFESPAACRPGPSPHPCSYTAGWGFWLPANLVNFVFVPPTGRVLFANAAGAPTGSSVQPGNHLLPWSLF